MEDIINRALKNFFFYFKLPAIECIEVGFIHVVFVFDVIVSEILFLEDKCSKKAQMQTFWPW